MQPKKEIIEHFKKSADYKRYRKSASAMYLLFSVGVSYAEECYEVLERHNLTLGETKHDYRMMQKFFDRFERQMRMMVENGKDIVFCRDYEKLTKIIEQYCESDE